MKKKILVASLLLFVAAFASFAEAGFYLKGTSGFRTRDWGVITATDTDGEVATEALGEVYAALNMLLTPAFGIRPWADSKNAFLKGLSFELSVDVGWGNAYGIGGGALTETSAFEMYGITPTIMAMFGQRFGKIVPYAGLRLPFPFSFLGSSRTLATIAQL